jgi:hypothetical protein
MTEIADVAVAERLTLALTECTRAIEELQVAVLTLTQILMRFEVVEDRRPIEERDRPVPTIHQEDT